MGRQRLRQDQNISQCCALSRHRDKAVQLLVCIACTASLAKDMQCPGRLAHAWRARAGPDACDMHADCWACPSNRKEHGWAWELKKLMTDRERSSYQQLQPLAIRCHMACMLDCHRQPQSGSCTGAGGLAGCWRGCGRCHNPRQLSVCGLEPSSCLAPFDPFRSRPNADFGVLPRKTGPCEILRDGEIAFEQSLAGCSSNDGVTFPTAPTEAV